MNLGCTKAVCECQSINDSLVLRILAQTISNLIAKPEAIFSNELYVS